MDTFNRTFEELKLLDRIVLGSEGYTFNRTFEELKYTCSGFTIAVLAAFNRTFEELKYTAELSEGLKKAPLIAPSRN